MSTAIQINDIIPKQQYVVTTDGQAVFSYNFPIIAASDIQVFLTPVGNQPDDNAQELALNSDYVVEGMGAQSGGSITLLIATHAGDRITLQRAMPYQRLSSYTNGRIFNPDNLDADFNSIVLMMQQVHAYYEKRFVHYENTIVDDTSNLRLPTLTNGQIWKRGPGGIVAATLEENPDSSTLRSELANAGLGTDGSRIVGYQDSVLGSTTVHNAIQAYISVYAQDTGIANAIIVTYPTFIGYREGMRLLVKIANANTDIVTINVNNAGIKTIKLQNGDDLPDRTIIAGMIAELVYDGSKFLIMNPFESNSDFETGDCIVTTRIAKAGWVRMDDGTIGSPSSSATTLKSDLCHDLFIHLWNTYDNTLAPVVEGRGANADADWLANKQIQLLAVAGRAMAAAGQGAGLTLRANGSRFGEEGHILTVNELASHPHGSASGTNFLTKSNAARTVEGAAPGEGEFPPILDGGSTTANAGSNAAHNTIQPTIFLPVFIKL